MSDAPIVTDAQTVTVGETLRAARIEQGWSVIEAADRLHLTAQALESIENNQFERLPGITFARGYIRSYAKILGLDADQLVKLFDSSVENHVAGSVQSIDRVGEARRVSRGMLQFSLFVVFLIIIAAAYYAWHSFNTEPSELNSSAAVIDRVEVERADGSMHVQTIDELEEQAEAINPSDAQTAVTSIGVEPVLDVAADTVAAVITDTSANTDTATEVLLADGEAVLAQQETVEPALDEGALQLNFQSDSWLRIVDADGKELSSGTQRAGEQLNLTGKPPLNIHLGYARGVSILYNGEPVDFSSAVTGETARIKLGQ